MLAAAWTLQAGGHVRVDVFYAEASPRTKAWSICVGALMLLLPFAPVLLWLSLPYVARSWAILERSQESSGLPLVFLLKTLIPVFAVLMALQGVAQAIRALAALRGALMPLAEILAVLMVVAVVAALMAGYPVALTLAGVSLAFAVVRARHRRHELRHPRRAAAAHLRRHDQRRAAGHPAVHLHGRDAGALAHRRGTAGAHGPAVRHVARRPGLFGRVWSATLLAASTGMVGATTVTMGLIMLPAMLRHGYDPRLAAGTVAASATLAQIIPPATVLVLLGDQLNNSYQAAQLTEGIFAPSVLSVSDLFAGAIVPGLALVALYLLFLIAMAIVWPTTRRRCRRTRMRRAASRYRGSPKCWSRRSR